MKSKTASESTPKIFFYITLFVLGFCALSYQVVLTRIFSLLLYYDFVFLAISFAILGIGLGAAIASSQKTKKKAPLSFWSLWGFGVTLSASLILLPFLPAHSNDYWGWMIFGGLTLPPFLLMGYIIVPIYRAVPDKSSLLYASDLSGASLGALCALPGLQIGPYPYVFLLTLLVSLICLGVFKNQGQRVWSGIVMLSVICSWFIPSVNDFLDANLVNRQIPGKPMLDLLHQSEGHIEQTRWSAIGRVDVVSQEGKDFKEIFSDGSVPAVMHHFDGDWSSLQHLQGHVGLAPFAYGVNDTVLSIGAGAGTDILISKLGNAQEITAVELNRDIVEIVREHEAYNGGILDLPGVKVVVDEGRSYVRASPKLYDVILFLLTQGNAAEMGGRVMMENFLMTQEAFSDYFDHLTPEGKIVIAVHVPHRASRYLMNWVTMLKTRGIPLPDAMRRFSMLSYPDAAYRFLLIFHKQIPSRTDMQKLLDSVEPTNIHPIYIPFVKEDDRDLGGMAKGLVSQEHFIQSSPHGVDIRPTTDDKPFQNDVYKGVHPALALLLKVAVALLGIFLILPYTHTLMRGQEKSFFRWSCYFVCVGIGFIAVEILLIRRLMLYLGYPALSLGVVLSSLLLGAGCGAWWTKTVLQKKDTGGLKWIPCMVGIGAILGWAMLSGIMNALLGETIMLRAMVAFLLAFSIGFLLGWPFPIGLSVCAKQLKSGNAWMWAINGASSVLGSILVMIMALLWGMNTAFFLPVASYVLASFLYQKNA